MSVLDLFGGFRPASRRKNLHKQINPVNVLTGLTDRVEGDRYETDCECRAAWAGLELRD
jgi:hypothetical protein